MHRVKSSVIKPFQIKKTLNEYRGNPEGVIINLAKVDRYHKIYLLILARNSSAQFEEDIYKIVLSKLNKDIDNLKSGEKISMLAKWLPLRKHTLGKALNFIDRFTAYAKPNLSEHDRVKWYIDSVKSLRKRLTIFERLITENRIDEIDFSSIGKKCILAHKYFFERPDIFLLYAESYIDGFNKLSFGKQLVRINNITLDIDKKIINKLIPQTISLDLNIYIDVRIGDKEKIYSLVYFASQLSCRADHIHIITDDDEPHKVPVSGLTFCDRYKTITDSFQYPFDYVPVDDPKCIILTCHPDDHIHEPKYANENSIAIKVNPYMIMNINDDYFGLIDTNSRIIFYQ